MNWNDLSDNAKAVIEWVKNPLTNSKENVEIQIGKNFQRMNGKIDIPITKKLFSEIVKYVSYDDNLETVKLDFNSKKYEFRLIKDLQL
jgi:hypothetical protein